MDAGAHGPGDQLPAEAMTYYWQVPFQRLPNQGKGRGNPWQVVIDTHGPTHQYQPGEIVNCDGKVLSFVDGQNSIVYLSCLKKVCEVSGPLMGDVPDNENRFQFT